MYTIADIRKEYQQHSLDEHAVEPGPIQQFDKWWKEAVNSQVDEVNAMVLATATATGKPSARVVLLKGFNENGFIFYTNYQSHKAADMAANDQVSVVFFWKELERQVRIDGTVSKVPEAESDHYFHSRPESSKIGAWASPQSRVIPSREVLEVNVVELEQRFAGKEIERPPHWGGYIVMPTVMEFWQGRPSRLHDRIQYTKHGGSWQINRLAP